MKYQEYIHRTHYETIANGESHAETMRRSLKQQHQNMYKSIGDVPDPAGSLAVGEVHKLPPPPKT